MTAALLISACTPLINRLAFFPDRADLVDLRDLPAGVEERFITTPDHARLQCYLLRDASSPRLLIYFHGNAGNIGHRLPELQQFRSMGLSVLGVGYRGYGRSTGRPSERGIYCDGLTALNYAQDSLHVAVGNIFICGRSIGTTVAVNTAADRPLAGVILVSPLTSGKEYAAAHGLGWLRGLAGNAFDNAGKAGRIRARVLIIHGTADEVVPYEMGRRLGASIAAPCEFVTIDGGDHNTLEFGAAERYWGSIRRFVSAAPQNRR